MVFKEALNSLTIGLGFVVGYLILGVLLRGSHWRVAQGNISCQFGVLPRPRHLDGKLHVSLGLHQLEVTLTGKVRNESSSFVTYQGSFLWNEDRALAQHLRRGLRGGLPYPVLTILEHLAAQDYVWGRNFAFSGRLVILLLWLSFVSGLVSALLGFLGQARPLATCLVITGGFLLVAVMTHDYMTPPTTIIIHFSKGSITFIHGWCYYLLFYLGILSITVGAVSLIVHHLDRLGNYLNPIMSFVQKLDHYFQKHSAGLKTTA